MMYFLLFSIAVLLFLLYKKLGEFIDLHKELKEDLFSPSQRGSDFSIKNWVNHIHQRLRKIEDTTTLLSDHFTADNPAGLKSDKYKKIENLIKIYSQHLVENKELSEKDALTRARFEVYEFGPEKIIDEIDTGFRIGVYWKEKDKAEESFYSSGILEKDIKKFWTIEVKGVKKITPYSMLEPIYDVVVKQSYQEGQEIQYLDNFDENEDYYRFVRDRAIIHNLEQIGVLKRVNKDGWDGKPKWVIPNTNIAELKKLVYEGESSHDDDYFEEQYSEGKLNRLFY